MARHFVSVVLLVGLTLSIAPLVSATASEAQGVTFQDIAANGGAGIDYRRAESPSDALFDALKQQPLYTFPDLVATPIKSRGAPGVALLDYDGDGDLDIYVTNGPGTANSLYSNQLAESGTVSFLDVAQAAGVAATDLDATGVCFGDLDNDGDPDLYVLGNAAPNRLFENRGDGTFENITSTSGLGGGELTASGCSMGDVNGDGLLDVAVANTFDWIQQAAIFVEPYALNQPNQLFVNQGGNTFADVSESSGILNLDLPPEAPPGAATISWAIALVDIDFDGDVDFVHADDQAAVPIKIFGGVDRGNAHVLVNDGTGHFTDTTYARGLERPGANMGLSFADFDSNGKLDFFSTNVGNHNGLVFFGPEGVALYNEDSRYYLQNEDGTFADLDKAGVRLNTPFGWGTATADYDNDGDSDILYHGAIDFGPLVALNPGVILANDGNANFTRDTAALASSTDHLRRTVHGMAVGDLDDNGFIDIVTASAFDAPPPFPVAPLPPLGGEFDADAGIVPTFTPIDQANFIFSWNDLELPDGTLSVELSSGNTNHWARADLVGGAGIVEGARASRDAIGAVAFFTPDGGQRVAWPILGGSSYASQHGLSALFGLGSAERGTLEILWPGGISNRLYNVRAGERIVFPEIPCDFAGEWASVGAYMRCVAQALNHHAAAGTIAPQEKSRFLLSARRAFCNN